MTPSFLKSLSKKAREAKKAKNANKTKELKVPETPTKQKKNLSFRSNRDDSRTITAFASAHGGTTFVAKSIELPVLGRNDGKISTKLACKCHDKKKVFYVLPPIDTTFSHTHSLSSAFLHV